MIIPVDIKPETSLYALGGMILEVFTDVSLEVLDINVLFEKVSKKTPFNISYNYFVYALDWLFLINAISSKEIDSSIKIQKCS